MPALSVTTTTALGNAGLLEADFNDLRRLEERVIQDSSLLRQGKRFIIVERRADFFGERWWRVRLLWVWSTSQYVNILPFPCQTKQAIISKQCLLNFITSRHKQYTLPKVHKRNNPNHWPHTQPKRSRNQPPIPVKARQVWTPSWSRWTHNHEHQYCILPTTSQPNTMKTFPWFKPSKLRFPHLSTNPSCSKLG